jgi:hypothetical protein
MLDTITLKLSDLWSQIQNSFSNISLDTKIDWQSKSTELALYLLLILILVFLIDRLLINSVLGEKYRIFVAPGVILHEGAHALLCLLTGAKITSISLFDKAGGSVSHEKPKIPFFGQILISLAPFVAGIIAIYFLSSWLGIKENGINISNFDFHDFFNHLKSLVLSIDFHRLKNWIILYLALSIAVTMTPSKEDLKNIAVPISIFLGIIGIAIYYKRSLPDFNLLPYDRLIIILAPILMLLILALILSIVIFTLSKVVKR